MKLAEALKLRADMQHRLGSLSERVRAVARYQEGETPAEDARVLLDEIRKMSGDLAGLVRRINHTNASATLDDGTTLTAAIARREHLARLAGHLRHAADAASGSGRRGFLYRQTHSELKETTDLSVPAVRAEADEVSRHHRELDNKIQQANWNTDLQD